MKQPYNETRYLEVDGTGYEMAYKKGKVFKQRHKELFNAILQAPFFPNWVRFAVPKFVYKTALNNLGRKYLKLHSEILANFHGRDLLKQVEGLATGFGQKKEYLYGLNTIEIMSSHMAFSLGCSSLALAPQHTQDGVTKTAYNHDFPEVFGRFLYVQKNVPQRGFSSLSLTYPTILGAIAGFNEKGLAITLNHAYEKKMITKPALPITLLLQECLNSCANVDEAIDLIGKTPVPNGSIMTLIDKTGKRVAAELSSLHKSFRPSGENILHTFNYYLSEEMQSYQVPRDAKAKGMTKFILKDRPIHAHSLSREKRFQEIIDHHKKYSDADLQKLLSDHGQKNTGAFDTICRHDEYNMNTLASAILDPTNQSLKVIYGSPCLGNYQEYYLNRENRAAA